MTEQLPSDTLFARLKDQIEAKRDNPSGKFITITASEMAALVECAEALKEIVADVQMDDHIGTDRAIAALAKLGAL